MKNTPPLLHSIANLLGSRALVMSTMAIAIASSAEAQTLVKPGPTNTGVPAGTVLRASGSLQLNTPDQIIDGLDITGNVLVNAPRVTIRRCRITCDSWYPVLVNEGASLIIEDTEIAGETADGRATSGIGFTNYVARRLNIHGTADGVKADDQVLLEDSWIHDLYLGDGDHADGIQSTGGGTNVIVRRNFIDIVDHGKGHGGGPNAGLQIGIEYGPNSNWKIESNWIYGGNYEIHADSGSGTQNVVLNNRFGRGPAEVAGQSAYPTYGQTALTGNWTESGSVWDDVTTAPPVTPPPPVIGNSSLWPATTLPRTLSASDTAKVELGLRFRSSVAGKVTGVRFYKSKTNIGTHTGSLWSNGGALLARATFSNEGTSGWQQVLFAKPIAVLANTNYVISYHTNSGHYSYDLDYFSSDRVAGNLSALRDGNGGNNGLYAYGASSLFPINSWRSANYWVDVVFVPNP